MKGHILHLSMQDHHAMEMEIWDDKSSIQKTSNGDCIAYLKKQKKQRHELVTEDTTQQLTKI